MKIKTITKITKSQSKYDIQVAINSNFYANGMLVHNCSMYNDHIHARSLDSNNHESRNWVKGLWGKIAWEIPKGMRICGENLYALHTVGYNNLSTYFMAFSVWDKLRCLSWDETIEYCELLGLETVPVIYRGKYDLKAIQEAFKAYETTNEGYVIRLSKEFNYGQFRKSVAKVVKPEFRAKLSESTTTHWMAQKVVPNKLKQL
jgi:hypothetical protein